MSPRALGILGIFLAMLALDVTPTTAANDDCEARASKQKLSGEQMTTFITQCRKDKAKGVATPPAATLHGNNGTHGANPAED
jgi:hypothetical protein